MSTTDSSIISKMGMCPYCASRRRCFVCVKNKSSEKSGGTQENTELTFNAVVVSPLKHQDIDATPDIISTTDASTDGLRKCLLMRHSADLDSGAYEHILPSKSCDGSTDSFSGKQLIIRGEMKRCRDYISTEQRKRTRHGVLPLRRYKRMESEKSISTSSNAGCEPLDANATVDVGVAEAEEALSHSNNQATEGDCADINESTDHTIYNVVDLTSDDARTTAIAAEMKRNGNMRYSLRDKEPVQYNELSEEVAKVEFDTQLSYDDAKINRVAAPATNVDENDSEDESVCSRFSKSDDESSCAFNKDDMDTKPSARNDDGLSNYELMRLQRIKRNNEKLESLGFELKPNSHEHKRAPAKSKRTNQTSPSRSPSRSSQRSTRPVYNVVQSTEPIQKTELSLFEGEHDDFCYICDDGGEDLVCCDYCSKVFHCQCHIPPLLTIPEGDWMCCECKATQMTRASKCGACYACLRDNCGRCKFCLDKPRFGGQNILKQACVLKQCPNKRYAPPAKVTEEEKERTLSLGVDIDVFEGRDESGGVGNDVRPFSWAR